MSKSSDKALQAIGAIRVVLLSGMSDSEKLERIRELQEEVYKEVWK